ncbi:hypothetical protein EJB05_18386 [Eragrostis curvula]|uniref:KIB1-4 beta-propeller domain-containing protein n=1 Tax=Eragrostis curvula TaxID=38414 RepID=A0A5J9VLH9_9POAL|nr:hypothetical protein EJB05_18386 [Eragrostis curvula]
MIPCSRKFCRLTGRDAGKMSVDWASLDQDLVELIGSLVLAGDVLDYVNFRAACPHWRASTIRPGGRGVLDPRLHPRRWMMLPEGHGLYPGHPDLRGFVRFFHLSTGNVVRVHLPLLDDHTILDSVDGLLLLHRDHDTAIRLLNPFTGDIIDLPPLATLLPQMEPRHYHSEASKRSVLMRVCAAVAVSPTGTVTVMLALDLLDRVAYASNGDQRWTLSSWKLRPLLKPVSFQGKLYAMQFIFKDIQKVHIYQIDPPCTDAAGGLPHLQPPVKISECPMEKFRHTISLVECGSELLLVAYNDASFSKLVLYRLADLANGKIEPLTSIGDNTLFLDERCLCVSHKKGSKGFPSISPNTIFCNHRLPSALSFLESRFEQYHLGTGAWTVASDGDVRQIPPPSPHTLIHHIFTCCHHKYWNKGLMYCSETQPTWSVKVDLRFGFGSMLGNVKSAYS